MTKRTQARRASQVRGPFSVDRVAHSLLWDLSIRRIVLYFCNCITDWIPDQVRDDELMSLENWRHKVEIIPTPPFLLKPSEVFRRCCSSRLQ